MFKEMSDRQIVDDVDFYGPHRTRYLHSIEKGGGFVLKVVFQDAINVEQVQT